jgi:hypothetical protein
MNISSKFFWTILILILLLPFSIHWKLFLFGGKTEGKVVHFKSISGYKQGGSYPVIEFKAEDKTIDVLGPDNYPYPIGKTMIIFYNRQNPTDYIPLNIPAIYLGKFVLFPGVLLLMWVALYVSLKQTQNQEKKKEQNRKIRW